MTEAPWEARDRAKAAGSLPVPAKTPYLTIKRHEASRNAMMEAMALLIKDERALHATQLAEMQRQMDGLKAQISDLGTALKQTAAHAPDALYLSATTARLKALKTGMSSYAVSFMRHRASVDGPAGAVLTAAVKGGRSRAQH
ncbi:hypothetical protein RGQ15_10330 [Paracoccus sp. MBLB3053]|uniref:Periplasmic heavy metal sensor n=1 Tax=Paracoccus aurantius TaxID=3073814 RepID=A0ABU2HSE5_9RHOB|nr:hypothetical protein [Paracoccus sp. MBLB3053]MDS9467961.1 hypothetical protein [Paracoccus sp. MBLB3053]